MTFSSLNKQIRETKKSSINQSNYDVVIVGSGAGAMASSIVAADHGLSVLVVEKSAHYGGTSALSGGGIWIPNNDHFKAKGGEDSYQLAFDYLKASTENTVSEPRLHAYLTQAPEMIRYLENNSRVRYAVAEKYPDYYPHLEGALPGGRTLDPEIFDTKCMGSEVDNQLKASASTLLMGKIAWTARDAHKAMARERGWRFLLLKLMLRYKLDFSQRRKTKRDRRAALGSSLVASLRQSMTDRNIPLWLNTDFTDIVLNNEKVSGIEVVREGEKQIINSALGVIFASGGFEQNQKLREKYLPEPSNVKWSATPPGHNTGAALEAGIRAGAKTDIMDWCWWSPTVNVPKEDKARGIFAERAFPGAIVVDGLGKRFVNEAAPYLEFGDAMYRNNAATGGKSLPAWVIFDANFRFNYAMGPFMPAQIQPDSRLPKGWLNTLYWKAENLNDLAKQIQIDPEGLSQTVERINRFAKTGVDEDFGRGGNVFDRYYGDTNVKPNPCIAPVAKGPFYAMRIEAGDIGTKGGLLTNEHAQVLSDTNTPIAGLYAIGNCSASVMGRSYPGAGATLGPAMTFGYIAANHIAKGRANGNQTIL
ncbi:fumarate reductase/succinate dehydrogenase flavoprotein domain protein [Shewanella halifaxensis HAW-EB4]|uniref:3-oxosteroid 1-dehydrogenase n=1 Tax=Shewanella halifaxensis (strain HAW-EB4) TaxID=458817 RepID=B0TTT8_SHEHH|nr:FAD-binding protein [Shewanella halifaxensis]ABZ76656.1 fumarate reductase/succinate dehydrogenase flavoprotein domain protein [Shewanella halifaxensis HAW-EB4]